MRKRMPRSARPSVPQTFAASSPGAESDPRHDSVVPHAPQTAVPRMRVARSAKSARHRRSGRDEDSQRRRRTCAVVDGLDEVGQEGRRGLHERAVPVVERAQRARCVPDRLNDLRNAHDDREPHSVEETGLMRERRRNEDAILGAEAPNARLPSPRRASGRRCGAARPWARRRFPT